MTEATSAQQQVVLTAHPLQRIGAFALACLVDVDHPQSLDAGGFARACGLITEAMVEATVKASSNDEGAFFLKVSFSFFPNSPINHSSRKSRGKDPVEGVRAWRTIPASESWPNTGCALCGRAAVGFYGSTDVPLAASISHRNTVPNGHAGMALCWPCVMSFHALPFGCRLTGGASTALHSYDDDFMSDVVYDQVEANQRHLTLGQPVAKGVPQLKTDAVRRLRSYERRVSTGVELLAFTNYNGKAALDISSLDHPTALWLRSTNAAGARGWKQLCDAHATADTPGLVRVARALFDDRDRIISNVRQYLVARERQVLLWRALIPDLASICRSYVMDVLNMKPNDEQQLQALAKNLATVIYKDGHGTAGDLRAFRSDFIDARRRRAVLQKYAMEWLLTGNDGALISPYQWLLLMEHDRAWVHRDYVIISLFAHLDVLGFAPADRQDVAAQVAEETTDSTDDGEGDD